MQPLKVAMLGSGVVGTEVAARIQSRSEALAVASHLTRGPTVADLMARDITTVGVEDSLERAHDLMKLGRLSHLPVVDGNARLIGVLTERHLLFDAPQTTPGNSPRELSDALVRAAMGSAVDEHVTTASPDEPAADARQRMAELRLESLPVVDEGGRLLGMVTEDHIARWSTRSR